MKIYKYNKKEDNRGYFSKLLSVKNKKLIGKNILEVNLSYNKKKGTIRGLHYQIGNFKETKIIYVLNGKIFDVEVNLKNHKVTSKILSHKNNNFIVIKENCAHGFQTLVDNTILLYLHSKPYDKKTEKTLNVFSKEFKINWPIKKYIISNKDKTTK